MKSTQQELFVKMVIDTWHTSVKRTCDLFDILPDERLTEAVAPGRNSGMYLLGHLTAIHDRIIPLLGFGEQLYPELFDTFVTKPIGEAAETASIRDLSRYWNDVNSALKDHFEKMSVDEWFKKHNSISEEDFAKEPHRNKLNVIINRTNHLEYHRGQLIFLKF